MQPPSRILIASDKFKGSLDAPAACAAIARGMRTRFPRAEIEELPIADGGEGFATILAGPLGGRWIEVPVHDALGRPVSARYLLADLADGPLAVIEMAEASGLRLIAPADRNILRSSTYGTGEMIRHAILENGAKRIVVGIGGSATNDGGAGMAAALGVRFLSAEGEALAPMPSALYRRLARIDFSERIHLPEILVGCDVTNPLLGPDGATRVFGPQKGSTETDIPILEEALTKLVRLSNGENHSTLPGAGAAGGLGFGLLRFADAKLVSGFDLLASITGLEDRICKADLVVTGEGSLDAQSLMGKGPVGIARLARKYGKRVIAFCGRADETATASGLFDSIIQLRDKGLPMETLTSQAAELLEELASL